MTCVTQSGQIYGLDSATNAMSSVCNVLLQCAPKPAFCPQVHRGRLLPGHDSSSSRCNSPSHPDGFPGIVGTQASLVQAFTTRSAKTAMGHYIPRCLRCAVRVGQPTTNSDAVSTKAPSGTCRGVSVRAMVAALMSDRRVAHVSEFFLRLVATPLCLTAIAVCDKLQLELTPAMSVDSLLRLGVQLCDARPLLLVSRSTIDMAVALSGPDLVRAVLFNSLKSKGTIPVGICEALLLGCGHGIHPADGAKIRASQQNVRVPLDESVFAPVPAISTLEIAAVLIEPHAKLRSRKVGSLSDRAWFYSGLVGIASGLSPPAGQPQKIRVTITFVHRSKTPATARNYYAVVAGEHEDTVDVEDGENMTWPLLCESLRRVAAARGDGRGRLIHLKVSACISRAYSGVSSGLPGEVMRAVRKAIIAQPDEETEITSGACLLTLLAWADVCTAITIDASAVHPETDVGDSAWRVTLGMILAAVHRTADGTLFDAVKNAPAFGGAMPVCPERLFAFVAQFSDKTHNLLSTFTAMHTSVAGSTLVGKSRASSVVPADLSNSMTSLGKSHQALFPGGSSSMLFRKGTEACKEVRKRKRSEGISPSSQSRWGGLFSAKRSAVPYVEPAPPTPSPPGPMAAYDELFDLAGTETTPGTHSSAGGAAAAGTE